MSAGICRFVWGMLLAGVLSACSSEDTEVPKPQAAVSPPNILLIVADDLGYTDLGSFGGEIATPNLDDLAYGGIRLTNFHAGPSCAPTRAMLLTGTDNHLAGMGSQSGLETEKQKESRLYQNRLLPSVPTIAEELAGLGYHTIASAKWHLGDDDALPSNRGFKRSFVLMPGGAGHFDATPMFSHYKADWREDGIPFTLPEQFYTTDFMTDKALEYIGSADEGQPWFAYVGYTAPHWPLQAPEASIAKYAGRYDEGWDVLRAARLEGAKRMGVVDPAAQGVAKENGSRPWSDLTEDEKVRQRRIMEVYAAMIDRVDENVGRLLRELEAAGELSNTVIFFMADNGVEGHQMELARDNPEWIPANFSMETEDIGTADSYVALGPSWARASAVPFRESKGRLSEGGIRVPAFVHMPGMEQGVDGAYMRVMDLAPTFLELAGGNSPESMMGRSLLARWAGGAEPYSKEEVIAAETYGRRMAQKGDWKILWMEPPLGTGEWELFNIAQDVGEQEDLSAEYPELRAELISSWEKYAEEVGVILPETPIYY